MSDEFKITVKDDMSRWLSTAAEKQIPFATAQALNQTAFTARQEIQADIRRNMKLRTDFIPNSVVVTKATKSNLSCSVGLLDRAGFMSIQEDGGTRTPNSGHAVMSIADENVSRTSQGGAIKSQRPTALLNNKNYFIKNNTIFQRAGKNLVAMWNFVKQKHYTKRMHFTATAEKVAVRDYATNFINAFEKALATMRV